MDLGIKKIDFGSFSELYKKNKNISQKVILKVLKSYLCIEIKIQKNHGGVMGKLDHIYVPSRFLKFKIRYPMIFILCLSYSFRNLSKEYKKRYFTLNKTFLSEFLQIDLKTLYNYISDLRKLGVLNYDRESLDLKDDLYHELYNYVKNDTDLDKYSFLFDKNKIDKILRDSKSSKNDITTINKSSFEDIFGHQSMTKSHQKVSDNSSSDVTYSNKANLNNSYNKTFPSVVSSSEFSNENSSEDTESKIRHTTPIIYLNKFLSRIKNRNTIS